MVSCNLVVNNLMHDNWYLIAKYSLSVTIVIITIYHKNIYSYYNSNVF